MNLDDPRDGVRLEKSGAQAVVQARARVIAAAIAYVRGNRTAPLSAALVAAVDAFEALT